MAPPYKYTYFSPVTPWIDQGDWDGSKDHCVATGKEAVKIPFPHNAVSGCTMNNNGAGNQFFFIIFPPFFSS